MQRRTFVRTSSLTLAALALLTNRTLANFLQDPWKIKMLTKEIGIFTEKGGTIVFMLSKDGIVVVDSQFPEQSKHLIDDLKKKTDKPFRLLVNTHHHGDHSGGNIAFKGLVQHVLAHSNSKLNQEKVAIEKKTEEQQLYPDQTFGTTWCEKIGKEKLCLHYFGPAHTNGDALVHFQHANILHMGDLVFNRRHPFVDRTAGANIRSWINVIEKTVKTFDKKTIFVCGHAAEGYDVLANRGDVQLFGDYLQTLLSFVENSIKEGKTKEDLLKITVLPGAPEWKTEGLSRPLGAAYDELTSKL